MSIYVRRFLYYFLIVVFLILGTAVIFYAEGWRIDLQSLNTKKVGAIYVRGYPANARIFLNGKEVQNNSWLFQHGTLINNLFPKNYLLELSSENYLPWKETIQVTPSLVAEVKYAVLVPSPSQQEVIGSNIDFFSLIAHMPLSLARGVLHFENQLIPGNRVIGWTTDLGLLLTQNATTGAYFLNDLQNNTTQNLTTILRNAEFTGKESLLLNPENPEELIVLSSENVSLIDPRTGELTLLAPQELVPHRTIGPSIAFSRFMTVWSEYSHATNSSTLVSYDTFLRNRTREVGAVQGKIKKIAWGDTDHLGILGEDGTLIFFSVSENSGESIAHNVRDFAFSPDNSKVAVLENESLESIPLTNLEEEYRRLHLKDTGSIKGIKWYRDNQHLFLEYSGKVDFLDVSDKHLENILTVVGGISQFDYDVSENKLYFLKDKVLTSVAFPKS